MLNNRHGQAKILTSDGIHLLLKISLLCARDQALFMFCLYTACRLSEARQMPWRNVFYNGTVLEEIVIPKEITKGQEATRTIPTHPSLVKFLEQYYRESLELVKLLEQSGGWSHWSLTERGQVFVNRALGCPKCGSTQLIKFGVSKEEQQYLCKRCVWQFGASLAVRNEAAQAVNQVHTPLGVTASFNFGLLFRDPNNPFLFPGKGGKGCLSLSGAGNIFDTAFARAGITGASSHSCRRTALTWMHAAGVPLRVLQEISGHKDLGALQRYLEVTEEEVLSAINLLS